MSSREERIIQIQSVQVASTKLFQLHVLTNRGNIFIQESGVWMKVEPPRMEWGG